MGAVLSKEDILDLLKRSPPLVECPVKLEDQIQPNGIDLTVQTVALIASSGQMGFAAEERRLCSHSPLQCDALGYIDLPAGCYVITYNEILHLPKNVIALGKPRSSLLRCGVSMHTAVWDAGYSGRSQSLMVVYNPYGLRLGRDAKVLQLVFLLMTKESPEGYCGIFQGENY
ncbi:deoxyuridine 5'-triphosphate nucleotidohydrolase [Chloroflexota bacterium]